MPLIDGDQIQITGEVDDQAKERFLAGAIALLFPIEWPEPLVSSGSMACGTPVIVLCRGSVVEVIEDGLTGFIVDTEEEAVRAISRIPSLDRCKARQAFERRWLRGGWQMITCTATGN